MTTAKAEVQGRRVLGNILSTVSSSVKHYKAHPKDLTPQDLKALLEAAVKIDTLVAAIEARKAKQAAPSVPQATPAQAQAELDALTQAKDEAKA